MDWRSLGGLPGGIGICSDCVVMQLLSGSSESWGAGGCVTNHGQKVAMRQWFIYRYLGMFILCGVVPGAPDGVSHVVCDLSTDAIIGTDTLGSILPHTLDIKKRLLFTEGGVSLQLQRRDAALSGRVFTVGHCSIPPCSEAVLL